MKVNRRREDTVVAKAPMQVYFDPLDLGVDALAGCIEVIRCFLGHVRMFGRGAMLKYFCFF